MNSRPACRCLLTVESETCNEHCHSLHRSRCIPGTSCSLVATEHRKSATHAYQQEALVDPVLVSGRYHNIGNLPDTLPVFPLSGVLLLPRGQLGLLRPLVQPPTIATELLRDPRDRAPRRLQGFERVEEVLVALSALAADLRLDRQAPCGQQLPFRLRRALGPDTVEETTFDGFKINAKIDAKKFEGR